MTNAIGKMYWENARGKQKCNGKNEYAMEK